MFIKDMFVKTEDKTSNLSIAQIHDLLIYRLVAELSPMVGLCAVITFNVARIFGYFESASIIGLIIFDIVNFLYFVVSWYFKKIGLKENEPIDEGLLAIIKQIFTVLVTLQWNLISYIFPSTDFWGYMPLFITILALLFDEKIVLTGSILIMVSIGISWGLNGAELLPVKNATFGENIILRCVSLVLTSAMLFILTKYVRRFKSIDIKNNDKLEEQNRSLKILNKDIISFTAKIVGLRDEASGIHIHRVEHYSKAIATMVMDNLKEYGLTDYDVSIISAASVLHDVGKITVSDAILKKEGPLTKEEFDTIKEHCQSGADIVKDLPQNMSEDFIRHCREICLYHHERYDGKGYPQGLKGDEIPIAAQIVGMADCYDALTSIRPYKGAYTSEEAARMILNDECGVFSDRMKEIFRMTLPRLERIKDEIN